MQVVENEFYELHSADPAWGGATLPLPTIQPVGSDAAVAGRSVPGEVLWGVHRHGVLDGSSGDEAVDHHLRLLGDVRVERADPQGRGVGDGDLAVDHQLSLDVGLAVHLDDALHALDPQCVALAVEELHEARCCLAVPPEVDSGGVAALETVSHSHVVQLVVPELAVVVAHEFPFGVVCQLDFHIITSTVVAVNHVFDIEQ